MTEILLYDYVEEDWWGDVRYGIGQGNLTAGNVVAQIEAAEGDITVRINSGGGLVFDGFAIYNALKAYNKGAVKVRIEGIAASIASIIAMSAQEIVICQAAMMMIHKPTTFSFGQMDADDMQREADALNEIQAVLNDIYATRTGLTTNKVQSMINAETWLSPDTAVALGFADSVEKATTAKPAIPENVFNHLFGNANPNIKAYANNAFSIKNKDNMSTVKELVEKQDKTNTLLDSLLNFFKGQPKNEAEPEVTPDPAPAAEPEPTPEVEPEAVDVEALKKENDDLRAQLAADKDKVENAENILAKANEMYDKVQNQLSQIQSNYKPVGEQQQFNSKPNAEPEAKFVKPNKNK